MAERTPKLTYSVDLPGGQDRLRQMILYVSLRCSNARRFGLIKLNKIIWKADFDSFAVRQRPVTGRAYQRLKFGPAAREMLPLHREMQRSGLIQIDLRDFGDDIVEHRTVALANPDLKHFDQADLSFVGSSIHHYWDKTGMEASDDSHGVAWSSRANGDPMPYESAYLSDEELSWPQRLRLEQLLYERGWTTE